ncbi:MT-A70 family methyltransferase [Intestinimonas sp. HCP28S3_D6]|uniref:MT-A70 family methyltransferase n=1 Tax=Intestinimonas sp. HCP28S3_D6 TaxID=3438942 RepID=UPI003F899A01
MKIIDIKLTNFQGISSLEIELDGKSASIYAPARKHSEKPGEARDKIVQLVGDLPRIELFARQRAPGWDAWGDEVDRWGDCL